MSLPPRPITTREAKLLTTATEPYLSCDDCFEQVDISVDALVSGVGGPLTPELRAHLIGCAACRDETRSLLELAGREAGVAIEILQRRFDRALGGST